MITLIMYKNGFEDDTPAFLALPASRWDVLEAECRLGIDNLNECYFEYEYTDLPRIANLLHFAYRGQNFFEELNYLAQRVKEMSESDRLLLNGALAIHSPDSMKDLINLTWHLDNIVIAEASTDTELGRFLVDNDFVEFPESVIPYLDFTKVGAEHYANHSCAFDRNLYYQDLSPEIAEVYDGRTLPPTAQRDYIFTASVFNHEADPQGANKIEMHFPASQQRLDEVTVRLGAHTMDELTAVVHDCPIARFSDMLKEPVVMIDLDVLASGIQRLNDYEYIKLLAVMEATRADSINEAMSCVCRLDNYDFSPHIRAHDVGSFGLLCRADEGIDWTPPEPDMEWGGM